MRAAIPLLLVALLTTGAATLGTADRARIDALLGQPALEHAQLALSVRSMRTGETLYRANAAKLLLPASAMKVVTTAVAITTVRVGSCCEFKGSDQRTTTATTAARVPKRSLSQTGLSSLARTLPCRRTASARGAPAVRS